VAGFLFKFIDEGLGEARFGERLEGLGTVKMPIISQWPVIVSLPLLASLILIAKAWG
jgi:hypothetical protein